MSVYLNFERALLSGVGEEYHDVPTGGVRKVDWLVAEVVHLAACDDGSEDVVDDIAAGKFRVDINAGVGTWHRVRVDEDREVVHLVLALVNYRERTSRD